jgi:hypothetical protein
LPRSETTQRITRHSGNTYHGLESNDNKSLILVLHQGNTHHADHGPRHNNKESLVLVNHFSNTYYKRRSNGFTTIVLQGLRIQEQGLDRKFQDLCWQD